MTISWIIGILGVIIAMINIWYGISKDSAQKTESERKECIDIIKKALQDALQKENVKAHFTYVFTLRHLMIIKDNKIETQLLNFLQALNDFDEETINEEKLLGEYENIIAQIYNVKHSVRKYILSILKPKKI